MEAEKDEETNGRYSLIVGDIFCTVFRLRTCMLEFTDYGAIIPAMRLNGTDLNEKEIKVLSSLKYPTSICSSSRIQSFVATKDTFNAVLQVYYSTQSISKPKAKSNEDSLREIEEAMKKVKEAQSLVSATVDPLMGLLNKRSR